MARSLSGISLTELRKSNRLKMQMLNNLKTLVHLALPIRGRTHQQRLENFYSKHADNYDDFRKRLLHGREEMWNSIPIEEGCRWVDFGGGTAANVENIADSLQRLESLDVVDLSSSLLNVAKQRIEKNRWDNVFTHCCDVSSFEPVAPVDVVTFSYSLTMIPNWFSAIDRALEILKPGGTIGVVDFFVSRKHPDEDVRRHGVWTRTFWPAWFAKDNVFLSPDHVPYLKSKFETLTFEDHRGGLPFVPLATVPYYLFVGRKHPVSCELDSQSQQAFGCINA